MTENAELQRAVERLTGSIDALEKALVRKDVYESNERGRDREVQDLRDDHRELKATVVKVEDKRAADRRLLLTSLALPLILIVVQLYLAAQSGAPS